MSTKPIARFVITTGEPAGIGPELLVRIAQLEWQADLVAVGDADLLQETARCLGLPLDVHRVTTQELSDNNCSRVMHTAGSIRLLSLALPAKVQPGQLDVANATFVLQQLALVAQLAQNGAVDAVVTNPLQKSIINESGFAFSGHTEYFSEQAGNVPVLMVLANDYLRVALFTTHLPLSAVPAQMKADSLRRIVCLLEQQLRVQLGIARPRIAVLGLNPHAGENGYLGREECDVMIPVLQDLRNEGLAVIGPLSADTAFTPDKRQYVDCYLAMYHDQGLPVLKALGFHRSVNITLGLPYIRTSVDHGTALDLAGTGKADAGSLIYAIETALQMIAHRSEC